jgi:hypothetical protein
MLQSNFNVQFPVWRANSKKRFHMNLAKTDILSSEQL